MSNALGTTGNNLTAKLSTYASASGLGGLINSFVAFGIGIAGVVAVVMIIIEGVAYMRAKDGGNVNSLAQAKSRIGEILLGFLLLLSIYVILRTINPELLNLAPRVDTIELLSPKVYKQITGKDIPNDSQLNSAAAHAVSGTDIDVCAIKALMQHESKGKAQAIGHDENALVKDIPSRKAFVLSGQQFSGGTFSATINNYFNKSIKNDDDQVEPSDKNLGLDWRYSHGIGTMQVTFFPSNWGKDYQPSYGQRNTAPQPRVFGGITYYPADMLDYEKNATVGAQILKDLLSKCNNDLGKALGAYNSGVCDATTAYAKEVIKLYNDCGR